MEARHGHYTRRLARTQGPGFYLTFHPGARCISCPLPRAVGPRYLNTMPKMAKWGSSGAGSDPHLLQPGGWPPLPCLEHPGPWHAASSIPCCPLDIGTCCLPSSGLASCPCKLGNDNFCSCCIYRYHILISVHGNLGEENSDVPRDYFSKS